MDLIIYSTVRADRVQVGDYVLGFGSVPLVVDEVHHKTAAHQPDKVAVVLWCWPAYGDRPTRRSTLEYDTGEVDVPVLPGASNWAVVWEAVRAAIVRARRAWDDDQDQDGTAQVAEAAPWEVEPAPPPDNDGTEAFGPIVVRAAGRYWRVRPGPPPSAHAG